MARIITDLRIEGFRSFRRAEMTPVDEYVPVIGLNSTGKSNVLRALSLLFNGVVDEARTPPSIATDYPDFISKVKKRVAVAAAFDLASYEVRGAKDLVDGHQKKGCFVLEREWTLAPNKIDLLETFRAGPSMSELKELSGPDRQAALAFVQAFEYRYVPNHVRPADLIRVEVQALRQKLINRLRKTKAYKDGGVDATMEALTNVARIMFESLSSKVARAGGRGISPDIPSDFADLAFQVGIRAVTHSGTVQPTEAQGSGTQSFVLLHVLDLLDATMREQGFGWKQFSVWGVEEPESFLHAGLRSQFAEDLRGFADDKRRQIFVTTHQDEFVRVAEHAWLMSLADGESRIERMTARDALETSSRLRITSFAHPLMTNPDHPLVIVEGKTDAAYLRSAIAKTNRRPRWKLVSLDEIDVTQSGGDNVRTHLNANRAVVASRPLAAPVFVLRDWEDGKYESIDKLMREVHEYSRGWRCPSDLANPELGTTFRGIERFLETSVIESVVPASRLKPDSVQAKYPLSIDGSDLESNKANLLDHVVKSDSPGPYLIKLAEWLDDSIQRVFGELPADLFT